MVNGGGWGQAGNGYRERYGEDWEMELEKNVNKKTCCVKELIDHVIDESSIIYYGTESYDSFLIFHDGLSAWWEKEAQDYIETRGFKDRQLCCRDPTNVGNRYRNKLCGDSPEICRALDSHGFADLIQSMVFQRSLTSLYDINDPRKFKMGTPDEVWSTMERCWSLEPTSERIVEDILKFDFVLEKIVEHNGCVVHDLFLRTGRRGDEWQRIDGKGVLKNKPQKKQRKETIVTRPVHPDAQDAYNSLTALNLNAINDFVENNLDLVNDNNDYLDNIDIDLMNDFLENIYLH